VLALQDAIEEAIAKGFEGNIIEQAIANARRRELIGEFGAARLWVQFADRNAPSPTAAGVRPSCDGGQFNGDSW
jgi:hypothetical protein